MLAPTPRTGWLARCGLAIFSVGVPVVFAGSCNIVESQTSAPATRSPQVNTASRGHVPPMLPCGEGDGRMATVARLKPGHTIKEVRAAGLVALPAVDGIDDGLVVIGKPDSASGAYALSHLQAVVAWGDVRPQTRDSVLRSCNYKFEDNAAALEVITSAGRIMVERGVIPQWDLDAPASIYLLTDDPTDATRMFAALSVQLADRRTVFVATLDRGSRAVLSAGRSHWGELR